MADGKTAWCSFGGVLLPALDPRDCLTRKHEGKGREWTLGGVVLTVNGDMKAAKERLECRPDVPHADENRPVLSGPSELRRAGLWTRDGV
jgi:hypothetical protein